jgi:hypothetical protein
MKTMQSARSSLVVGFALGGAIFVVAGCAAKTLPAESPEVDASTADGSADAASSCNMASPVLDEGVCKQAGCAAAPLKRTACVGSCDNQPKTLTICRDRELVVGLAVTCWQDIATGDRYELRDTGMPSSYMGFRQCACGISTTCEKL